MNLSEELIYRGFTAETTIKDPKVLDNRESKKFYWGADPSADSLTIGNLAALMMCACFIRHGYQPYLLVGGATGQIGDPKENSERDLKSLDEVEHNKRCIKSQIERIINSTDITMVDNYDWFKNINYLDFLREVGKAFSMTQLLDRQFVQNRIGTGGSGISYAEFSYTLIQGYDFLHLFREHGVSLQLCGADQYGNCTSGIHLIKRLENADADVWSTPLVIDPVTGRKFGKSEGNAVWLASSDNGSGNYTSIFDFYQFWLNQPDSSVEYLLKIYTLLNKNDIETTIRRHSEHPEDRFAQKTLAKNVTEIVHGKENAKAIENLTNLLFDKNTNFADFSTDEISEFANFLPTISKNVSLVDALTITNLAESKKKAREFISAGAISINGTKITEDITLNQTAVIKKGKNKFAVVK
ncbi:tyrosine--tRNA ligase [Candidatus Saccharibacteria bacterium]|uniref:Tyrosine--tRNA ligase n=1 Tax=Candidatus Nanosyncoccus alces TaxID=2171997 RepID=A0ABY0FPI7_9BACT|nr:tyrosine--tRNA ligase [Candidatus Nanosyncoccus alces]MBQ2643779.1 tyrosine--tRNA ligase [Candidatus Saccharibacteria bacterium]RYC75128.1 Tyrosine--tRNA ligase [Candidatus Nanosyncoccus alces]